MIGVARRWWPPAACLLAGLAADLLFKRSHGGLGEHAAGHLASASGLFPGLALIAIMFWAAPRVRRQAGVLIGAIAWLAALGVVMVGNLTVVEAIGARDWTDESATQLGAGIPGFGSGHQIAGVGARIGVAAAILLAIALLARGDVRPRVAVGSIALSLLFPPFIIPGAGVIALVVALCVARGREGGFANRRAVGVQDLGELG